MFMSDTPKAMRQVNRQDLASLCNVSLPVVDRWVALGAPFVVRGSKGTPWVFDISEVFAWRMDAAVKAAVEPFKAAETGMSREEADRRRAVAMAIVAEIEAATAQRAVVSVEDVGRLVETEYSAMRQSLLSLPGKLADRCKGLDRNAIRSVLQQGVDETLSHLSDPERLAAEAI